ncbi:MAG: flagellar hook-associated protein FlgL [Lachnospiraceae bacterium]|nr:flagellar hook-associated protein FlgL [Lachnospiraceae bacterium]
MRITNKIMQRNNLSNINTNKILEDKLTSQLSSEKKIIRPSDDPVIAIRALRLRSNVTEVTQYYSKNIPDATSWLKVTEDALSSLSSIITSCQNDCTKGANGDLTSSDRNTILEELKAFSSEIYKTGDADYAGRYVFTGYRTDTSLSFQKQTYMRYQMTEQVDRTAIDSVAHVNQGEIATWTAANFNDATHAGIIEQPVEQSTCYRFRLSYDDLDDFDDYETGMLETEPVIQYYDAAGTLQTMTSTQHINSTADPYSQVGDNDIIYVADTGEMLLGKNIYDKLMATKDNATTGDKDESQILITYQKTEFKAEDLRPQHFFRSASMEGEMMGNTFNVDSASLLRYNESYLDTTQERQSIEYDVGFNTTIRVNSTADECFKLGIGREIDDLVNAMQAVVDLETTIADIEKKLETTTVAADRTILQNQLDAANKAFTYQKDIAQKRFEQGITAMQGYLNDTSLAITNNGTRSSKLALIESRLQNQKTTFETLQSQNEDIDITEVAIGLESASVTYEAALMATSKIMQNTLLNYL